MKKNIKNKHNYVASLIARKILKYNSKCIIAIGIFGSVATNTHNSFSDIDLVVITNKKIKQSSKSFLINSYPTINKEYSQSYKDQKVTILIKFDKEVTKQLFSVGLRWTVESASLLSVKVLYDPTNFFSRLACSFKDKKNRRLLDHRFNILATRWLSIAYEFLGKLHGVEFTGAKAYIYGKEFIFCIANVIKAVNQDSFQNIYNFVEESKFANEKPKLYYELASKLLKNNMNKKIMKEAVLQLWSDAISFTDKHDIRLEVLRIKDLDSKLLNIFHENEA